MNNSSHTLMTMLSSGLAGSETRRQWFADHVYSDDKVMTQTDNGGNTVAALLADDYTFSWYGCDMGMALVQACSTAPSHRGRGYMTQLMQRWLRAEHDRGAALAAVWPEADFLYYFFERLGFATTMFVNCQRYTAVHPFASDADYEPSTPTADMLERLERLMAPAVVHSHSQFDMIEQWTRQCHGALAAVQRPGDTPDQAVAIAGRDLRNGLVTVRQLVADTPAAAQAALAQLRMKWPDSQFEVWSDPRADVATTRLRPRAMTRIVNVATILQAMAAQNPHIHQTIRVHDPIIAGNNGVFILANGTCTHTDSTIRRLTLDVGIRTLGAILASAPDTGSIFGLDTQRFLTPFIAL